MRITEPGQFSDRLDQQYVGSAQKTVAVGPIEWFGQRVVEQGRLVFELERQQQQQEQVLEYVPRWLGIRSQHQQCKSQYGWHHRVQQRSSFR